MQCLFIINLQCYRYSDDDALLADEKHVDDEDEREMLTMVKEN